MIARMRTAMLKTELASIHTPTEPAVAAVMEEPKRILPVLFMIQSQYLCFQSTTKYYNRLRMVSMLNEKCGGLFCNNIITGRNFCIKNSADKIISRAKD